MTSPFSPSCEFFYFAEVADFGARQKLRLVAQTRHRPEHRRFADNGVLAVGKRANTRTPADTNGVEMGVMLDHRAFRDVCLTPQRHSMLDARARF